ncbi:hypothetical protein FIBSPDRAFT_958713 [Athelia psychrophila]|uniref:Uncharacterized protein n=1 Tax=Athelia psychrophila TaxID=1759441 RepID=A0A166E9R5_9AGAM|nr:hypothetical protein FIBSPDRAFT_958713 [Fibularhizoctonia sp. CBS 109695]
MFGTTKSFASAAILLTMAVAVSGAPGAATTSYSTVPKPSQLSTEGTFTGTASSIATSVPNGYTTVVTQTFQSPSRTLTVTSTIPLGNPSIPLSVQSTLSTVSPATSGTSLSSGGTVPISMPSPSAASGTTASSSSTGTAPASSSGAASLNGAPATGLLGGIMAMVGFMLL